MSPIRIAALFLLAAGALERPAVAQTSAVGGSPLPAESMLNRNGLTRRWWSHATINPRRDKLLHMAVDEQFLFLQSSSGTVSAFNCESGKRLWARPIGPSDRAIYPVTLNDEFLFVVAGLKLYAVRKATGDIAWELEIPGQPSSSPAADDQRVFVGCLDGSLYAFDLALVRDLYSQGLLPQYTEETIAWRYRTSKEIVTPAVPQGALVAFASRNGSLYIVAAEDRKLKFQFETDAKLSAPIVPYGDTLLVASEDSSFYSLNARSGKSVWQFTTGNVIRRPPVLIDDEVYLLPERDNLYKLSAETGQPLWPQARPRIMDFLAAGSRWIFVADHQNNLVVLSRETGSTETRLPLSRFTKHLINDRSDRIYVATETGLVMCLHELGRDFPRFHMHPDRQPLLPDLARDSEVEEPAVETPAQDAPADEMPADETTPAEDAPETDQAPADDDAPVETPAAEEMP